MVVGILRVTLHMPEARSLKDRRAVVRSAVERVRARFHVAVAEVGDQTHWQLATVAVCAVANDRAHVNEVLDKAFRVLDSTAEALVTQREMVLQSYSDREALSGRPTLDARPAGAYGVDADDDPDHEDQED